MVLKSNTDQKSVHVYAVDLDVLALRSNEC
ncbi:MAG: hypothetical protein RLZZ596_621 [Pseudomonadota bacterium]|jgi:hypothetical protein